MITLFKGERGGLEKVEKLSPDVWVHAVDPQPDEVLRLERELGVPHDFMTAALDVDERPRTDREDDTRVVLLRVPRFHGLSADIPFTTIPLAIILTDHVVITVCSMESDVVQDFVSGRVSGWATAERDRFLLQIFLRTAAKYLLHLREIDRRVDELEDRLQASMRNRELLGLLKYQKSLTYFTTALRSNELMMERLRTNWPLAAQPDNAELLQDVLTENRQAIEMVSISSNILSQMMDAFASIISNNLNVVMKFLTSATIILMLPTLVASFYGMNVALPLQDSPYAFALTLALSLALSVVVILVFLKKDWF